MTKLTAENTGHGHVRPRPDGVKARCGGPGLCSECSREKARLSNTPAEPGRGEDVLCAHGENTCDQCSDAWSAERRALKAQLADAKSAFTELDRIHSKDVMGLRAQLAETKEGHKRWSDAKDETLQRLGQELWKARERIEHQELSWRKILAERDEARAKLGSLLTWDASELARARAQRDVAIAEERNRRLVRAIQTLGLSEAQLKMLQNVYSAFPNVEP